MSAKAQTNARIGFIQGRLSPMVDGKIQAFPATHWRDEFAAAAGLGIGLMEWTLDQDGLAENPFNTRAGREEIRELCEKHNISIPSVTGDCFMQAPFWKADGEERDKLLDDFGLVVDSSASLGVRHIVVPLVDNGSITTPEDAANLRDGMAAYEVMLRQCRVQVVYESDFNPLDLKKLIDEYIPELFGINYDIGNSAALGMEFEQEFRAYGDRILNVHIKDRLFGGTTVPLGTGAANLPGCVAGLERLGYTGNYILQTARAAGNDHAEVLGKYRDMTCQWVEEA